jgi:hypothetical protein
VVTSHNGRGLFDTQNEERLTRADSAPDAGWLQVFSQASAKAAGVMRVRAGDAQLGNQLCLLVWLASLTSSTSDLEEAWLSRYP